MTGRNQFVSVFVFVFILCSAHGAIREPWVKAVEGFFEEQDCVELINAAEAFGFPVTADSIDYNDPKAAASWEIDVFMDNKLFVPRLAALYDKYLPKLRDFVSEQKIELSGDYSEPSLDWVFVRKYAAGGERQMLKLHSDTNLFTVNVALNDDFEGGGFFYYKSEDSQYNDGDPRPRYRPDQLTYDYLEQITRRNTSLIVFPESKTGRVLIHNFTLFHAIAPIEKGTRYALIFFYDMHHPAVERFYPREIDVIVKNGFDFPVDLQFVDINEVGRNLKLVMKDINTKEFTFRAKSAQRFEVTNAKTGEVVQVFYVPDDKMEGEDCHVYLRVQKEGECSDAGVLFVPEDKIEREDYHVHLRVQEDGVCSDAGSGDGTRAKILNRFPYPVSLVWRSDLDDGLSTIVVDDVPDVWHLTTQDGHRFDVVKRGTDEVVDYFKIIMEESDMEVVVEVGPHERSPPFRVKVLNGFPYPVSLYWVGDQDKAHTRELMMESLQDVNKFESFPGHRFLIVERDSGEVVDSFEIMRGDLGQPFIFYVGPSSSKIREQWIVSEDSKVNIDDLKKGNAELSIVLLF